jgi:DNA modification methylase
MNVYYQEDGIKLYKGDNRLVVPAEPNSLDAMVTDPPYAIAFMGKAWDDLGSGAEVQRWHKTWATKALQYLKPGAFSLVFGGTRSHHRLMSGLEDAGFEICDTLMWVHGSGFPKSLDVSKAIDKAAGAERKIIGVREYADGHIQRSSDDKLAPPIGTFVRSQDDRILSAPATDEAKRWDGYGTALKPAWEPIVLCQKPIEKGLTIAQNVLKWGTGGLNIDACRIQSEGWTKKDGESSGSNNGHIGQLSKREAGVIRESNKGRWPANLIHDGSDEVVSLFPSKTISDNRGDCKGKRGSGFVDTGAPNGSSEPNATVYSDSGSAARFFYTAKASNSDRGNKEYIGLPLFGIEGDADRNIHPTVKPQSLIEYLIKLVTPIRGIVYDCFAGSGTTLVAAKSLNVRAVGIEREEEHCKFIVQRLKR